MEPGIPTSFIPKRPVLSEPLAQAHGNRTVGLFSLLAFVSVVATIIAFAGVYLYGQQLKSKETKLEQSITSARDGLGTEFVADMRRLNLRIKGVDLLIKSHVVVSPIFQALQKTTLRSVEYDKFTYSMTNDPSTKVPLVQVDLTGTALTYATIALQSDAFTQSDLIKNPVFSNLNIDDKTDRVSFKLKFNVDPADLSYRTLVDGKDGGNTAQASSAPSAPSSSQTSQ